MRTGSGQANERLAKWLRLLQLPGDEPIYTEFNLFGDYRKIAKKAGMRWKRNAPRKSYNTYDAALTGSFRLTSRTAGNSASMLGRYYNKPTSQAGLVAQKWFKIGPQKFGAAVRTYATRIKRERRKRRSLLFRKARAPEIED